MNFLLIKNYVSILLALILVETLTGQEKNNFTIVFNPNSEVGVNYARALHPNFGLIGSVRYYSLVQTSDRISTNLPLQVDGAFTLRHQNGLLNSIATQPAPFINPAGELDGIIGGFSQTSIFLGLGGFVQKRDFIIKGFNVQFSTYLSLKRISSIQSIAEQLIFDVTTGQQEIPYFIMIDGVHRQYITIPYLLFELQFEQQVYKNLYVSFSLLRQSIEYFHGTFPSWGILGLGTRF
ncbi:MAG: hypothetical protein ACXITV_06215 [Luteibaculaceae bacterium]